MNVSEVFIIKFSKYNVVAKAEKKKWIVYNILSEALVEMDEPTVEFFNNCLQPKNETDERLDVLYRMGFLIDDDYDEIDFIRYANKKYCTKNDSLQLTIAPTMDCNCKCIYCFETPHPGKMTKEVMEGVIRFIKKQHVVMKYNDLYIDWFGGEPLLCWDIIRSMSEKIIEYTQKEGIAYSAGIITNGYLINERIVREMEQARIVSAQITIDGPKEIHDSRRMLRNGLGTYDTILANLACFKGSSVELSVRVNIDKRNQNVFDGVCEAIYEVNPDCKVYPAEMECFPNTGSENASAAMNNQEFSIAVKSDYLLNTVKSAELPLRFVSCQAQKFNSFGIDERGLLYKCWNELGMENRAFGNIFDYPDKICGKNLVCYTGHDCISDPECLECKVLPICMGGCANLRMFHNKLPCIAEKYCIESYVINMWNSKKEAKE